MESTYSLSNTVGLEKWDKMLLGSLGDIKECNQNTLEQETGAALRSPGRQKGI